MLFPYSQFIFNQWHLFRNSLLRTTFSLIKQRMRVKSTRLGGNNPCPGEYFNQVININVIRWKPKSWPKWGNSKLVKCDCANLSTMASQLIIDEGAGRTDKFSGNFLSCEKPFSLLSIINKDLLVAC